MDELEAFRGTSSVEDTEEARAAREVLVIAQGATLLAIPARAVVAVVPWQTPTPLPLVSPSVMGVVQDRGRLVAVHRYEELGERPRRLVVCTTSHGLIGIAATSTQSVGSVTSAKELVPFAPSSTSAGALTLLDPEELARRMVGGHAAP